MFKGQKYQPNTNFQFVNYQQSSAEKFKEPKRQKFNIPNTMKFQLSTNSSNIEKFPNIQNKRQLVRNSNAKIPYEQTHIFVVDDNKNPSFSKSTRKPSYTITNQDQKLKLIKLIILKKIYKSKPKITSWKDVVNDYNKFYNLNENYGLTIEHARIKLNQIISSAKTKSSSSSSSSSSSCLTKYETLALEYDKERQSYKNDINKDIKIDDKYENKHPNFTKIYKIIIQLQTKIESIRCTKILKIPNYLKNESFWKNELWLLHKRILDLKNIEEQYQILEKINYINKNSSLSRVKVSPNMRDDLFRKAHDVEIELENLLKRVELNGKVENYEAEEEEDIVVDTELLDKK